MGKCVTQNHLCFSKEFEVKKFVTLVNGADNMGGKNIITGQSTERLLFLNLVTK